MKRVAITLSSALLMLLTVACNQADNPPAPTPTAVEGTAPVEVVEIPVEALPDPLPEPYLFRDEFTIESEPVTETIYVVQPGDTLAQIAEQFCLTVAEIQRLNNIVDITQISIGQELRIPIREGGCGAAAPAGAEDGTDESAQAAQECLEHYTVQPGDTLADIGFAYGLTWQDVAQYNGLTDAEANTLQVGQVLCIPPPPEPEPEPVEEQQANPEPPG